MFAKITGGHETGGRGCSTTGLGACAPGPGLKPPLLVFANEWQYTV